jgi:Mrp family chromosome partitioning ATPase/O-antigen ligase
VRTIDRPTPQASGTPPPPRRRTGVLWLLVGLAMVPVLAAAALSAWGVAVAVVVAALAGLGLWVWRRGFAFIEMAAFLIHFDGIGAGPVRLGRVLAAVAFGLLLWKLLVERWRPPAIPARHWIPPLLLLVLGVASGAWSSRISAWLFGVGLLGLALAYFSVAGLMVDSHEKIEQYLRAYWVGGLFGSGAGVLALFLGTRSMGFGGDPNYFGLLQASMIALTIHYRRHATTPRQRNWYTVALLFVFAGAAGAGSRSGIIGACLVIIVSMVTRPRLSGVARVRTGMTAVVVAGVTFLVLFVANPANLSRGFSDRGAGRLDAWASTVLLIQERPVFGQGLGQLRYKVLPNLAETAGVKELDVQREDLAAHNTWLDIQGDLGLAGSLVWNSMIAVTLLGFLRPRWAQTRELSTTLVVMMVPVLSSAFFQPLINNKLAWSLIGLSAALQVPSWQARWRGFPSAMVPALPSGAGPTRPGAATAPAVPATLSPVPAPAVGGIEAGEWRSPVLARWDLRISRRFRTFLLVGAVAGAVLFGGVAASSPVRYSATADVVMPQLNAADSRNVVVVSRRQVQGVHTLVTSDAYADQLRRLSGLDQSVPEIRRRMSVDRPLLGAFFSIVYTDTDEANARIALPHLVAALDAVIAAGRAASAEVLADELRPILPGEQRFYTGPLYLRVGDEAFVESTPPRTAWSAVVGALTGTLVAAGFVLLQQRRPRVNNDDDLYAAIRLPVWAHVGRAGRRYAATRDQYRQVVTMATDVAGGAPPRRFVVASPRPDRAARGLAMGIAAALAAEGRRVVLVDADLDTPLLSARLGGARRRGLVQAAEGAVPLEDVVRRVNRWRMPSSVRRLLGGGREHLRFVPAGRRRGGVPPSLRPDVLERFDPDVVVVLLAPSLLGDCPAAPALRWADATALALVEGRTVTFDAEDAAAQVLTFATGPAGVVMLDV